MAKTPNYTPDMVETMRSMYLPVRGEDQATRDAVITEIEAVLLAEPFKVVREKKSIISKMCRMLTPDGEQLYVRKVPISKVTGEPTAKKSEMAVTLATAVNAANPGKNVDGNKIPRLNPQNVEKLNKSDIQALQAFVTANTVEPEAETTEETES